MQIAKQMLHDFRLRASASDQLAHPGNAHGHKRKLHGGEKAVERHEHEYADEPQQKHSGREGPSAAL